MEKKLQKIYLTYYSILIAQYLWQAHYQILKRSDKYVALSNLGIYYTWKNIKKSYKNNKFKISTSTWNEEFELPDGSYSVSDTQDYFKYILKNMRQ